MFTSEGCSTKFTKCYINYDEFSYSIPTLTSSWTCVSESQVFMRSILTCLHLAALWCPWSRSFWLNLMGFCEQYTERIAGRNRKVLAPHFKRSFPSLTYISSKKRSVVVFLFLFFFNSWGPTTSLPSKYTETYSTLWMPGLCVASFQPAVLNYITSL